MPDQKKGVAYTFTANLVDAAATTSFRANPTLAAGDVQVSIDGGPFANLSSLPTVSPTGGVDVAVTLSNDEMNGDRISVRFHDVAGSEWLDVSYQLYTTFRTIDDLPTAAPLDASGTRAAVGLASANLDTQLSGVAAIKAKTDNLPAQPAAVSDIPTVAAIADKTLGRNIAGSSDGGRTVTSALRSIRNKVEFDVPATGQFTVYQEDDTTPAWTGEYTATSGASPVTAIDPA